MRHASALVLLLAASPAVAQTPVAQTPATLTRALAECAVIARDSERLACYDAAIAETSAEARAIATRRAEASAKLAAEEAAVAAAAAKARADADALAAAQASREAFGSEGIKTRNDRFAPAPGEVQEIETTISDTFTNRQGFSVFLLENNQLWREVDVASTINTRAGDKVRIERAAMGGYKLHFVRQKRAILVKRLK